jgi:hypothetical protein
VLLLLVVTLRLPGQRLRSVLVLLTLGLTMRSVKSSGAGQVLRWMVIGVTAAGAEDALPALRTELVMESRCAGLMMMAGWW